MDLYFEATVKGEKVEANLNKSFLFMYSRLHFRILHPALH